MLPRIVDVTTITGKQIIGKSTSWQTPDGPYIVEHLAGMSPSGDLLVFWWSPAHDWQAVNVSQKTGHKVASPVTSWQTPDGPYIVEHLAGMSPSGDLLVFWWSPQHDWQAVNVSQITGQRVASPVTSWQTPDGPYVVEHLAGMSPSGDLLVFWWSPQHDWQAVNVSQKTGHKVASPVTSWQTPDGPYIVEHLAGMSPSGDLLVFWWSPQHDWQAVNTSYITGERMTGTPTSYLLKDAQETVELLAARSLDGSLMLCWWTPALDWQALSLSDAAGSKVLSDPCSWLTPDGNRIIEHIAAEGPNHSLIVFWGDSEPRRLTDAVQRPFQQLKFLRNVRRKVIAVLWYADTSDTLPSTQSIESIIFGSSQSVRDYYLQNSNGLFTIDKAALLGWYQADKPYNHYFVDPADMTDADGDGWIHGDEERWAEGIRKAAAEFNFQSYDQNPYDGVLAPEELAVLFVMPGTYPRGFNRTVVGREYPHSMPLVVDGVTIGWVAEVYIGGVQGWPLNLAVVAHELTHMLIAWQADDMYFQDFFQPFAAGDYSMMDNTGYTTNHYDPFPKLKCGWLRPRIICRSGRYTLPNIETSHKAWILMDPRRGTYEYFIVENRWPGNSYDTQMRDAGLGVWHIMEDPTVYGDVDPPPGVSAADWSTVGKSDWGRRAIRMIRPIIIPPFDNSKALWDGAEAATGYDLLSVDPNPQHPTLSWADGTPSGFNLRSISAAGAMMTVTVEVPF